MTAEAVMGTVARLLRERERSNVTMAQRVASAGDALVLRSAPMSDRDADDIAVALQANVCREFSILWPREIRYTFQWFAQDCWHFLKPFVDETCIRSTPR